MHQHLDRQAKCEYSIRAHLAQRLFALIDIGDQCAHVCCHRNASLRGVVCSVYLGELPFPKHRFDMQRHCLRLGLPILHLGQKCVLRLRRYDQLHYFPCLDRWASQQLCREPIIRCIGFAQQAHQVLAYLLVIQHCWALQEQRPRHRLLKLQQALYGQKMKGAY